MQERRRRVDAHEAARAPPCALDKMADRLLDWFSVLMDEAGGVPPPQDGICFSFINFLSGLCRRDNKYS